MHASRGKCRRIWGPSASGKWAKRSWICGASQRWFRRVLHEMPPDTPPNPSIAGTVEFVEAEARLLAKKRG